MVRLVLVHHWLCKGAFRNRTKYLHSNISVKFILLQWGGWYFIFFSSWLHYCQFRFKYWKYWKSGTNQILCEILTWHILDAEKENLCLYGLPNETWEVNLPAEEVPPELPEPALGINFARDGMDEKDWLALVAVHSDAWLLSVSFYFGARFGFSKEDR